ncbi:hypothetical protein [Pandoraea pulmonicola]|uniref:Uncharacterized protein n=1 Tax=Pandoraea pulmonicola TaxID=93221 RepID=A0AAJ4Z890_PANPU|nr:hypothetical protein [Pandoraea pulmonicola]SUA88608.1 Uncharacterised protein [Pandoraea pulmonicola]
MVEPLCDGSYAFTIHFSGRPPSGCGSQNTIYALFGAEEERGYVIPISAVDQTQGKKIEAGDGPWTMVLDQTNHYLYISTADGTITIVNTL